MRTTSSPAANDPAWTAKASVVVGTIGGVTGILLSMVALAGALFDSFDAMTGVTIAIACGALVSLGCAVTALFASGRASVRPRSATRLQLMTAIVALPFVWGAILLVAAIAGRRAARASDVVPSRAKVPTAALALATVASTIVFVETILRGVIIHFADGHGPGFILPFVLVLLLGVAAAMQIWRRPVVAATLASAAGALWLLLHDASILRFAGWLYVGCAVLAVLVHALRRRVVATTLYA
jgi:hypothetical protein